VREALRVTRRRRHHAPLDERAAVPAAAPVDVDVAVDVRATLAALPPEQRAILVLRDLEGWSEAEAAAALDVAVGTAKSRLSRARDAFRRSWPS
jgi:RNA polymerase sigma-70 factor (ECF subfamily)